MKRARAFTLIEVLVALAIVAVALAAGMRALAQSAEGATSLKARTLALWVAQNRLARAQLADPWPGAGTRDGDETQAGTQFAWRETVTGTHMPQWICRYRKEVEEDRMRTQQMLETMPKACMDRVCNQ